MQICDDDCGAVFICLFVCCCLACDAAPSDLTICESEAVCVELSAHSEQDEIHTVIFSGTVSYESLRKAYNSKLKVAWACEGEREREREREREELPVSGHVHRHEYANRGEMQTKR